jgi:hypothetical protein
MQKGERLARGCLKEREECARAKEKSREKRATVRMSDGEGELRTWTRIALAGDGRSQFELGVGVRSRSQ